MEFLTGENRACGEHVEEQTSCNYCGACCIGGGPILRSQDERLIKMGKLQISDLYTQRAGELMFNKETMKMVPLATDHIKIKIQPESLRCRFLKEDDRCGAYIDRPFECRSYKCWDPREIEQVYSSDEALTREDVIGGIEGLWDLVADHQARCSYGLLEELFAKLDTDQEKDAKKEICEVIAYDRTLRETLVESGRVKAEILDFLFGRPLAITIVMFNHRVESTEDGDKLVPVS